MDKHTKAFIDLALLQGHKSKDIQTVLNDNGIHVTVTNLDRIRLTLNVSRMDELYSMYSNGITEPVSDIAFTAAMQNIIQNRPSTASLDTVAQMFFGLGKEEQRKHYRALLGYYIQTVWR